MKENLVSVIITTHERPMLLDRAIRSIKAQSTQAGIRVIVVSDTKSSYTHEVASALLSGDDLFVERGGQPGPADSRNLALQLTDDPYIVFLDDDDTFQPGFFEALQPYLNTPPSLVMYCDPYFLHEERSIGGITPISSERINLGHIAVDELRVRNRIPNNCIIFPRKLIADKRFDESLILFEDWEFLINVLATESALQYLPITGPTVHKNDRGLAERRGARNDDKLLETILKIYSRWPGATMPLKEMRKNYLEACGISLPLECF